MSFYVDPLETVSVKYTMEKRVLYTRLSSIVTP